MQNHYELSGIIGAQKVLSTITVEDLHIFCDGWVEVNGLGGTLGRQKDAELMAEVEPIPDDIFRHLQESKEVCNVIVKKLSKEKIAAIAALHEFNIHVWHSEYYLREHEAKLNDVQNRDHADMVEFVDYYMSRFYFLKYVLNALNMLNQNSFLENLSRRYGLHAHMDSLLETSIKAISKRGS